MQMFSLSLIADLQEYRIPIVASGASHTLTLCCTIRAWYDDRCSSDYDSTGKSCIRVDTAIGAVCWL